MCVFNNYLRIQEELREYQKDIMVITKNYNNVLTLFQNQTVIDSFNAEKIKDKYDELQNANEKISLKKEELQKAEMVIEHYLAAMNGMAIRYQYEKEGIQQTLIFEMETNTYGEQVIKLQKEN